MFHASLLNFCTLFLSFTTYISTYMYFLYLIQKVRKKYRTPKKQIWVLINLWYQNVWGTVILIQNSPIMFPCSAAVEVYILYITVETLTLLKTHHEFRLTLKLILDARRTVLALRIYTIFLKWHMATSWTACWSVTIQITSIQAKAFHMRYQVHLPCAI